MTNLIEPILAMAFMVNLIVQMTKNYVPVPTKLWCLMVSAILTFCTFISAVSLGVAKLDITYSLIASVLVFIIAYIAMYGFDTFKKIWARFRGGENINDNKDK